MIYLDNAATSFPKPPSVSEAVAEYISEYGVSSGRSSYNASIKTSRLIFDTREKLAALLNIKDSARIAFTMNATYALNMLLFGFLKPSNKVVTSSIEHNAVMRPLNYLQEKKNIEVIRIPSDSEGYIDFKEFSDSLSADISLVIINHASNVTGSIQDIKSIGELCKKKNIPLLVDAAQTAGSTEIDVEELNISMLAFSGHKGLMGPTGIGALYVKDDIEIEPIILGGTGSNSEHEQQPYLWPDILESGTLNITSIAGLNSALDFIDKTGLKNIISKKNQITSYLLENLNTLHNLIIYGHGIDNRTSTVSINIINKLPSYTAAILDKNEISVRVGLHCAPSVHKTIGTFPNGTIRISPGYFSESGHIDTFIKVLKKIV